MRQIFSAPNSTHKPQQLSCDTGRCGIINAALFSTADMPQRYSLGRKHNMQSRSDVVTGNFAPTPMTSSKPRAHQIKARQSASWSLSSQVEPQRLSTSYTHALPAIQAKLRLTHGCKSSVCKMQHLKACTKMSAQFTLCSCDQGRDSVTQTYTDPSWGLASETAVHTVMS